MRGKKENSAAGSFKFIAMTEEISNASYDILIEDRQLFYATDVSADKLDYQIAAFSGTLTAAFDIFWVGDFSLSDAQSWGRKEVSDFVLKVSQSKGYKGRKLDEAIEYLEKLYKIPSDRLTNDFGGGLQHHLRDFVHHPTIVGLIMSIISQFTGKGYGTDKEGNFITKDFPNNDLIGSTVKEKIFNGTVIWAFHLVSDMAGSSYSAGKGTGIPGPVLSFFKEISVLPVVKDITAKYKDDYIAFSVLISKIFNSTYFKGIRFDLRTELGVSHEISRQMLPVLLNDCIVKGFYFVRRICVEAQEKDVRSLEDLNKMNLKNFIPTKSRALARMLMISSVTFNVVEKSAAFTKAAVSNKGIKDNFAKDFLLNINYIGIAHFAFAFKNDARYIYDDIKGQFQPKSDKIILDHPMGVSVSIVEIETKVDNRNLYVYTFDQLLKMLVSSRDYYSSHYGISISVNLGPIYNVGGEEFKLYKLLVTKYENHAFSETSKLLIKMLEQNAIPFEIPPVYQMFSNPRKYTRREDGPFILKENGKRVAYFVTDELPNLAPSNLVRLKKYDVDSIQFIRLHCPKSTIKSFDQEAENAAKQSDGFIKLILIKDFFDKIFGPDEFPIFMEYVTNFNERARTHIGLNTVIAPSNDSIEKFKKDKSELLNAFDYMNRLPEDIYKNQANILYRNYINRGLYRAMTGSSSFADSFVSSEWFYSINKVTNSLDQTAVVTGYLKSVEQLLFSIVGLWIDSGKTIRRKGNSGIIDFTKADEDLIDTTLGSLIKFVNDNTDIFDVNTYVKRHIIDALNDWRVNYRNDHLHKDNLYESNEIDAIREKAIYIYFLLLGGFKIADGQFDTLGVVSLEEETDMKMSQFAFTKKRFMTWIDPILDYGIPKDAKAILFNIYEKDDFSWELQLIATNSYSDNNFKWTFDTRYSSGHDLFLWKNRYSEADALAEAVNFVKEYLIDGRFSEELKKYSAVIVSYICHHKAFKGIHNEVVYKEEHE